VAPRNADQSVAASVVGDSLGIDLNDLDGTGNDGDDLGDDEGPDDTNQDGPDDGSDEEADDQGRVSHTEDEDGGLDDMRLAEDEQPIRQLERTQSRLHTLRLTVLMPRATFLTPKLVRLLPRLDRLHVSIKKRTRQKVRLSVPMLSFRTPQTVLRGQFALVRL
jgi:hypothetical protein